MILLYGSMGMVDYSRRLAEKEEERRGGRKECIRARDELELRLMATRIRRAFEQGSAAGSLPSNLKRGTCERTSNQAEEQNERFAMLEYDAGTPLEKKDLETNERFAMLEFD
ncbi:MAG TPA: hypothetical protein VJC21_02500 [Candidatus Nanoarchaeia archaeon]|nr:hypothetical protein [Candidatus Nanoarchaeia archaeon]